MPKMVGIDLGTSTSSVAVFERGQPRVLALDERDRIMPSVVTFDPGGKVVVGRKARNQRATNPEFTFTELKRLLGRREDDAIVAEIRERVPYDIARGPDGEAWLRGPDRAYSPEELLAYIVRDLLNTASRVLGENVSHAVIGVPANFDEVQRNAVRRAALLGGVQPIGERVALLSESTAAAIAYGLERGPGKTIGVYDLGGGTFDVSILKVTGMSRFRVLASAGDSYLGGEDFDAEIVTWLAERFRTDHGLDLRADAITLQRLQLLAEKAKVELSGADEFRCVEAFIAKDPMTGAQVDLDYTLTRDTFEELVAHLIDRTVQPCLDAMAAVKLDPRKIDDVVMVGGMTRVPAVEAKIAEIFGRTPLRRVSPIEAVVMGCAIQAASRAGELASIALSEVTTSSFGLEARDGAFVPILKRGTQIPFSKTVRTAPGEAGCTEVALRISQGDLNVARENRPLGVLLLPIDTPGPVGAPLIDVTFDLDPDGVLTVTAKDRESGRAVERALHGDIGLDREGLANMRALSEDDEQGPEPELSEEFGEPPESAAKIDETLEQPADPFADPPTPEDDLEAWMGFDDAPAADDERKAG